MNKNIYKQIEAIINQELIRANNMNPLFSSIHEAYAIMKEEFEEVEIEIENIGIGLLDDFWKLCRDSKKTYKQEIFNTLETIEKDCKKAIIELIQLSAMCKKSKKIKMRIK